MVLPSCCPYPIHWNTSAVSGMSGVLGCFVDLVPSGLVALRHGPDIEQKIMKIGFLTKIS